jgi:hypothetical protein
VARLAESRFGWAQANDACRQDFDRLTRLGPVALT